MRMNLGVATNGFSPETYRTRSFFRSLIAPAAMMTVIALLFSGHALAQEDSVGAVYTSTNAAEGNSVLTYSRAADGTLTSVGPGTLTGGTGVGPSAPGLPGLASQGSVTLSADNKWLLVVNAGSNDVTVFSVTKDGLEFRSITSTGGSTPVSVTILRNVVYVVNQGSLSVVGFRMDGKGNLTPIPGAVQVLATGVVPVQVSFAPKGGLLVVTDIVSNTIYTLVVTNDVAGAAVPHTSNGLNPFGFAFDGKNHLVVSEGFLGTTNILGGTPSGESSVSSYNVTADGALESITSSATTNNFLACWVSITNDGRFAYVSDTGSGVISTFAVAPDGSLSLLNSTFINKNAPFPILPIDTGISNDSRFLYTLVTGPGESISGWRTDQGNGSLTPTGTVGGGIIPASAVGIAVR